MQNRPKAFHLAGHEIAAAPIDPGLYLVSTPIGNLGDITIRALETLAAADIVAAEDTRVSRILLERYGIRQRPVAYHEHNAASAGPALIEAVAGGKSVALVSDAGTPLVSDPGYRLVREAVVRGLRVVPVPGASAVLAALTASGLPSDTFLFAGFLPSKEKARADRLNGLAAIDAVLIFYESPRRLAASLAAMSKVFGTDRSAVVARELTKRFEELRRASLGELAAHYEAAGAPKGEIVVCIAPPAGPGPMAEDAIDDLLLVLVETMPASRAAADAAKQTGRPKNELYARLLALRDERG